PRVFVRPNEYEASRANIIIYNWPLQNEVKVDLSGLFAVGDRFVIRDALTYYGPPVLRDVYQGMSASVPMRGLTTAIPVGREAGLPHTGPDFGVFVVTAD